MSEAAYAFSVLPNGVRVATAEMPHMESVSVGLWAAVGSRHEPAQKNGAAHFLEHLLFKGTKRRSARAISKAVEGLGGDLNAFTSEDHTCFYAKAGAEHFDMVADVLSDMYVHSIFPSAEIERERSVIREEIAMVADQPSQLVEDVLSLAVWPGHPLGRPLVGTVETVDGLDRDNLMEFWRTGYQSHSTIISVAGQVEHRQVVPRLEKMIRSVPEGRAPRFVRWSPRKPSPPRVVIERQDNEQTQLAMGFSAPGRAEKSRFAVRVLSAILGENMGSRLFQSLRERRGICYSVQSATDALAETGLFSISLGLSADKVKTALGLIRRELDALCDRLVGARELKQAKEYLIGQHRLSLEGTSSQMMWLGESVLGYGRVVDPTEAREAVAAVTAEAIRESARACFGGGGLRALAAVGPLEVSEPELLRWFDKALNGPA